MNTTHPGEHATMADDPLAADPSTDQLRRAGVYDVLAAMLRHPPGSEVLDYAARLEGETGQAGSDLAVAFAMLSLAARHSVPEALRDEFHMLFIGLGRGELVPYGSWYQTGFLMEKPLAQLRADLQRLGFERTDAVREPEDHIAALCEVMSLLIRDAAPLEQQRHFFESHLGNWAPAFFGDLETAQSSVFYRSVARLGSAFIGLESRYLSLLD